jgi:hypothetical protein
MSDFSFQIMGDGTPADKAIEKVVAGLEDIKKKAAGTTKGLDFGFQQAAESIKKADQQTKAIKQSLSDYGPIVGKMPGLFDRFKGGVKAVANVVTPFNQALEIGGKALRFAEAGLNAYSKSSARAAEDVAALTKEFSQYKKTVMETVGLVTVELAKPAVSFDRVRESIIKLESHETWRRLFVKKGEAFGDFFGDDETADPVAALNRAASGLRTTLAGMVDHWNTDGQTFIDSFAAGMKKTEADTKKAADEARRLAEEHAKIGRALLGPGVKAESHRAGITVEEERQIEAANREAAIREEEAAEERLHRVRQAAIREEEAAEERLHRVRQEMAEQQVREHDDFQERIKKAQQESAEARIRKEEEVRQAIATGLGSITADFINMAAQGEMSVDKLLGSLAKLAIQIAAMKIGGPWGAFLGSLGGGLSLGGNRYGGDHVIQGRPLETFGLPRAQYGADWRIGGPPGPDRTLVAFWGSKDESVHVRTPADRHEMRRSAGAAVPPVNVAVIAQNNARDITAHLGGYDARRVLVDQSRKIGRRTR